MRSRIPFADDTRAEQRYSTTTGAHDHAAHDCLYHTCLHTKKKKSPYGKRSTTRTCRGRSHRWSPCHGIPRTGEPCGRYCRQRSCTRSATLHTSRGGCWQPWLLGSNAPNASWERKKRKEKLERSLAHSKPQSLPGLPLRPSLSSLVCPERDTISTEERRAPYPSTNGDVTLF